MKIEKGRTPQEEHEQLPAQLPEQQLQLQGDILIDVGGGVERKYKIFKVLLNCGDIVCAMDCLMMKEKEEAGLGRRIHPYLYLFFFLSPVFYIGKTCCGSIYIIRFVLGS